MADRRRDRAKRIEQLGRETWAEPPDISEVEAEEFLDDLLNNPPPPE